MRQAGQLNDAGLLYGKTGICLYYYISGRVYSNQQFTKYAEGLLDEICKNLPSTNINFDFGLGGIGWAIEYLVQNKYITGNTDEILQDIDVLLLKQLTINDGLFNLNFVDGTSGYLYYLIYRLQNQSRNKKFSSLVKLNKEMFIHLINQTEKHLIAGFASINKDVSFDLFSGLPLSIILLRKAYNLGIYNEKIEKIIEQVSGCLDTMLPALNLNRLYLASVLLGFSDIVRCKQLEKCTNLLLHSTDYKDAISEAGDSNWSLRIGTVGVKSMLWYLLKNLSPKNIYYEKVLNTHNAIDTPQLIFSLNDTLTHPKIGISEGVIGVKLANYLIEGKI
jgi:hypothetical protein